jgi:cellulose synthase/poly-beta-1,6-N-acetylglucosamine synthase-like glycosyltransferase
MVGIKPAAAPGTATRERTEDLPPAWGSSGAGPVALMDEGLVASGFGYERFTALAGPLGRPDPAGRYRVQFRGIHRSRREWVTTRAIALVLAVIDLRFIYWLVVQSRHPRLSGWLWPSTAHAAATDSYLLLLAAMAAGSIAMQLFLLVNVLTVSRACLAARDPVPVEPDPSLRVAFLTTIVPGKEPVELAERTLRAATRITYEGPFDVWLLDEGDSDDVKRMCARLGVRHFTRKGRGHPGLQTGIFALNTKHGNYNRWLREHAGDYDVIMFVDTDHVPLPIMAERLLGYFRDPDVAFVVAPQFYGNQDSRVTRWAESAQYLFHSVIQRAGNRRGCAMLVGTNAAIRTAAIKTGFADSITEDMATSLRIHASKNEATGRGWRSVYTPDLVAVGEGPRSWTEFFGQQTRWSAGTFDAITRQVWRVGYRLRPGAMLHYFLMLTYYPSVAIGWIMGIGISACYLGFGVSSLRTDSGWWLTYYVDVAAMQFVLYRFMRRHNVSPHEPAGSSGLSGMLVSALTAPVYARSLIRVVLRRKLSFTVTAKGSSASPDRLWTFRYSLMWAVVPLVLVAIAILRHRPYPMMITWTAVILLVCLAPVAIWLFDRARAARAARAAAPRRAGYRRPAESAELAAASCAR